MSSRNPTAKCVKVFSSVIIANSLPTAECCVSCERLCNFLQQKCRNFSVSCKRTLRMTHFTLRVRWRIVSLMTDAGGLCAKSHSISISVLAVYTRSSSDLQINGRCERPTALWPPTCNWWRWRWFHHRHIETTSIRWCGPASWSASSRTSCQCVPINSFETTASWRAIELSILSLSLVNVAEHRAAQTVEHVDRPLKPVRSIVIRG